MNLPIYIINALDKPIDYSLDFSNKVIGLGKALSQIIGLPYIHDDDMNYNPGQFIGFFIKNNPEDKNKTLNIELRFYISSKSNLFCIYCVDKGNKFFNLPSTQHPIKEALLPAGVQKIIHHCVSYLQNHYQIVDSRYFFAPAPLQFTQLDGLQATVFESLFAELI